MTGTVMKPVGVAGKVGMSTAHTLSPSYVNSFRISAVTSRLLVHLRGDSSTDNTEFFNLCLSLARGIDYAVSNNEIPGRAPDLPYLLKQVCQRKNDPQLQAAIMVLMISVKSACSNGWFSEKEKEELHIISDEMQSGFCSVSVKDMNSNMKNKECNFHPTISTIMSRFYPGMKMGEILSLVEAMPGYDSYVTDLHISKNAKSSPDEKIYLFVAQTDNIEMSSCIISPQQVSFLLNGEGVDRRTCVYKDPGPQMPTPVTHMLKYGSNLLQVVGQFNGRYIIVIAFMSVASKPSCPAIPDYIPPAAALPDSDNEIIEGPSRISLKCPISFSRIKIPVKGHSCKHLQCFDFSNYMGINSRRPLWRCPHCSQSVCFHDIRIDQSMVKVLKEVEKDVSYVKISADGSWEAVTESNEHTEKSHDVPPLLQETTIVQNVDADILDLTEGDNEVDTGDPCQDDDKKPSPAEFHGQSSIKNAAPCSTDMNNVHRNIAPHMEDGFWREFYSSGHATRTPDVTELGPVRDVLPLNREIEGFQRNNLIFNSMPQGQSQISVSNNLQLQQYDNLNNIGNGHARYPTPASYVTRTSMAVQALPAQTSARMVDGDRQQHFSRSHLSQHQVSRMTSAPSSQHMSSQNQGHRDHSLLLSQTASQHGARSASPQQISGGRHTSALPADRFNSHEQQSLHQRTPLPVRSSAQPSPQVRLGGAHGGLGPMTSLASSQSQYSLAAIQRATQIRSRTPSIPAPIQTSGSSVPVASMGEQRGSSVDASTEQNWRPTGRMRGSLSGRAYTEALNQFIIHPNQPVQAARPPVLNTPRPFIPPHLQALMANNMKAGGPDSDSSMAGGAAGVLPDK